MTLDDDTSVYVGGLPYDATEDTLRKVFDLYGHILAIKIINDREVGGKCYGFVTYTNPRSAIDAINDMNGSTIGGRPIRVNEVKTRGGRPNRETVRRDFKRDFDWPRGGRDRDHQRGRYQHRDRSNERPRNRDGGYEPGHDGNNLKEKIVDNNLADGHDQNIDRDHGRDGDQDKDLQRFADNVKSWDKEKKQESASRNDSQATDSRSRDYSSSPSGDNRTLGKEELDVFFQRRDELQNEIGEIERKLKEKNQFVAELEKRAQKLENALGTSKKISSQRKTQLAKAFLTSGTLEMSITVFIFIFQVRRSFVQVRECSARLKSYEQELQELIDTGMLENEEDLAYG